MEFGGGVEISVISLFFAKNAKKPLFFKKKGPAGKLRRENPDFGTFPPLRGGK